MKRLVNDDIGAALTFIALSSMVIGIWYGVCRICGH
jgi:hypothetical protein